MITDELTEDPTNAIGGALTTEPEFILEEICGGPSVDDLATYEEAFAEVDARVAAVGAKEAASKRALSTSMLRALTTERFFERK